MKMEHYDFKNYKLTFSGLACVIIIGVSEIL